MKYISVTSPGTDMSKPIFNYFNDYLVSLGEPTTSPGWSEASLRHHLHKMLKEKPETSNLYIDSGGFQIIVDYIEKGRIKNYVDAYHQLCKESIDKIDTIFSLDIYNRNLSDTELYEFNKYSIEASIEVIQELPQFADKQLFVLQTSNRYSFGNWKKLIPELEVNKYYKKWAIGGLVGLKKMTNAKFSHAVPATLWLLTYQKKFGAIIDQVHWLGQSSRLSFISMSLMERLYGLNMTSDSSQLVRFAALEAKLPYMFQNLSTKEFRLINSVNDVFDHMINQHSMSPITHTLTFKNVAGFDASNPYKEEYTPFEYYQKYKQLHNVDFIECQSQNVYFDMQFAEMIASKIISEGIDSFNSSDDLVALHPLMKQGRIAVELFNNILYFRKFKSIIETGDLDAADQIMDKIHTQYEYYINRKNQNDYDKAVNTILPVLEGLKEKLSIARFALDEYNNDEFISRRNYFIQLDTVKTQYTKHFANIDEQIKALKSKINNTKHKDKTALSLAIQNYIVANYTTLNSLGYTDSKYKEREKYVKGILEKQFVTTDIITYQKNISILEENKKQNMISYKALPETIVDESISEFNMLQAEIYDLEHKIMKIESDLEKLKK